MSKEMKIGEKNMAFPGTIRKVLAYQNLLIVLFSGYDSVPNTPQIANQNIWAFDQRGERVWMIQEMDERSEWKAFTDVWINEKNQLIAGNSIGYDMIVNPLDGMITLWRDPSWPSDYKPRPW